MPDADRPSAGTGIEPSLTHASHDSAADVPGRVCPHHYGYSPRVLARAADVVADTVYVVGGLYGNPGALDAIEALARGEPTPPRIVFNGDFHWFDADPALYAEIQHRVRDTAGYVALRGNVETEIESDDPSAGCGCAYPESVSDEDVARSNAILARLRTVAEAARVAPGGSHRSNRELPMHAVAKIGALRVGIVHGDAWSLAGWRFAHEALHDPGNEAELAGALSLGTVHGFACTHTCGAALRQLACGFVINNGAAGMANFAGARYGLISRISVRAVPPRLHRARLYGVRERGVWVDALKLEFDLEGWLRCFDTMWPAGSAAALSYRARMAGRTSHTVELALGRAAQVGSR